MGGSLFSEGQKRFKEWCVDCQPATCNHLGDACWCGSRQRGRRSANETAEEVKDDGEFDFVEGEPQDWEIDCDRSEDCPHLWYCAEKLCIPRTTFPFAAWRSLSVPHTSGIGSLTPTTCLKSQPCEPGCFKPTCNSLEK